MNVSEYIFNYFAGKGIDSVFCVTGGQAMYLDDAVGKDKRFHVIFTHHEQSAAMSADAYGRIRNKPAIALVTAGPGSVNAINGVVGAYTDSSPMIVISGQAALSCVQYQQSTGIRQFGIQGIYIKPLVNSVVKYFITIDDIKKLDYYLDKAYNACLAGRPGPVWIDVPLDIQGKQVDRYMQEPTEPPAAPETSAIVCNAAVKHTMERLMRAKRPLILAGQGVSLSGAREVFRTVVETFQIPVITARLGIDLLESDNALYVGRPGNYGERAANYAVQNADVILCLGCRLASALVGHSPAQFGKHAYIIAVDIDPKELDKPGPSVGYKLQMDVRVFLEHMQNAHAEYALPQWHDWIGVCGEWKRRYPVALPEYRDETPVNSYYFADTLSRLASADANILVDTGSCFHVVCQTWKVKKGQHFLTTGGISSMGYWVAGIGACVANDRKDTIVITGDGSLQMNLQEFATIRHNNLPIKLFVFNNNGYLLIRNTQRNFMEDRFVGEGPSSGVWCPDLMRVATAYDIPCMRVDNVNDCERMIREVLSIDGPAVLEVMTPEWQMLIPRVTSDKLPDGRLVSRDYEDMFPFLPAEEHRMNMIAEREP